MATISRLKVGQVLWQVRRLKCGNTTTSRGCLFSVKVMEIAKDGLSIMASSNGNPARHYTASDVKKIRVNKPQPKGSVFGEPSY